MIVSTSKRKIAHSMVWWLTCSECSHWTQWQPQCHTCALSKVKWLPGFTLVRPLHATNSWRKVMLSQSKSLSTPNVSLTWVNACQIWLNSRAPSNSPSPRSKNQTVSSEQTWSKGRSLFVYNLYLKKSKLRTRNSQKKSYGTQRALRLHTTTSCSSIRPRSR